MRLKENLLLKWTVIVSLIGFSIILTVGIVQIFLSSQKRDNLHMKLIQQTSKIENEILKIHLLSDEMTPEIDTAQIAGIHNSLDTVHILFSELCQTLNMNYQSLITHHDVNLKPLKDQLFENLDNLRALTETPDYQVVPIRSTLSGLSLAFKKFYSEITALVIMDNNRYKYEIYAIIALYFAFLFFAGLIILRLINKLISADRKLISNTIEVETRERERIATDLHDGLGALLSGLIIHLQVLNKEFANDTVLSGKLKHLGFLATTALQSIEEVINNLNPVALTRNGLIHTLSTITDRINDIGKTHFTINADNLTVKFNPNTRLLLYRICNELINNALKHSEARSAKFTFFNIKKEFHLVYQDDGVGFPKDIKALEEQKRGLFNLMRRVESLDGKFRISSEQGKGVEIEIIIHVE
jgi:hypothetical protein